MTYTPISTLDSHRLRWISFESAEESDQGQDVIAGLQLTPKSLPCRYFYDDRGSQLFEKITELPEYYPTRTEQWILEEYAEAIARMTGACDLVELGSGSSRKTRLLLDAYTSIDQAPLYCSVDVSAGILQETALTLLEEYPTLSVVGLAGTYEQALVNLPKPSYKPRLLMFLGSTLGNLSDVSEHAGFQSEDPKALEGGGSEQQLFLQNIQSALDPGDYFLLGVDLQKPISVLEAAYNDRQGVTAEFNLNMLTHINRQFQGNFAPDAFQHVAFYNESHHQIEMHLECLEAQTVTFERFNFAFDIMSEERIRTEISRKFDLMSLIPMLKTFGFQTIQVFQDPKDWFALVLCCLESGESPIR